ncbi:hypothetical protein HDU79_010025, partial [Rhizoclosmatium sp. JEL0117]
MYSVSSHCPTSLASFLASLPNTRLGDFDLATRFALQLTHALNHLAENNVYHLNLSLKNVLIDQYNLHKLTNPTFIEDGVTSIPSIERLPLYVSVTSTQANFDSDGPNTTGIYRDEIHTYILTLFDPTEINIPSFTSTFKGFSEPWSVYIKSSPTSSKTKAKPRKPLALKEKNAVYQCYRLLTLKQLIAEYPLSKTELLREAAIDIPPLLRAETWSCLLSIDPNAPTPEYELLDKSIPTQSDHQLSLDIPRCHQYNILLSSPDSHAAQTRILKAWIQTESPLKNVYWQGLDALLAPFLALNYPNEGRAYVCFKAFV